MTGLPRLVVFDHAAELPPVELHTPRATDRLPLVFEELSDTLLQDLRGLVFDFVLPPQFDALGHLVPVAGLRGN